MLLAEINVTFIIFLKTLFSSSFSPNLLNILEKLLLHLIDLVKFYKFVSMQICSRTNNCAVKWHQMILTKICQHFPVKKIKKIFPSQKHERVYELKLYILNRQ